MQRLQACSSASRGKPSLSYSCPHSYTHRRAFKANARLAAANDDAASTPVPPQPLNDRASRVRAATNEVQNIYRRSAAARELRDGTEGPPRLFGATQQGGQSAANASIRERLRQRAYSRGSPQDGVSAANASMRERLMQRVEQRQPLPNRGSRSNAGPNVKVRNEKRGGGKRGRSSGSAAGQSEGFWVADTAAIDKGFGVQVNLNKDKGKELVKAHRKYTLSQFGSLFVPYEDAPKTADQPGEANLVQNKDDADGLDFDLDEEVAKVVAERTPSSRPGRDALSGPTADYNDPDMEISSLIQAAHAPLMEVPDSGKAWQKQVLSGEKMAANESGRGGGVGIGGGLEGRAALREIIVMAQRLRNREYVNFSRRPDQEHESRTFAAWSERVEMIKREERRREQVLARHAGNKDISVEPENRDLKGYGLKRIKREEQQLSRSVQQIMRKHMFGQYDLNSFTAARPPLPPSEGTTSKTNELVSESQSESLEKDQTHHAMRPGTLATTSVPVSPAAAPVQQVEESGDRLLALAGQSIAMNGSYGTLQSEHFLEEMRRVVADHGYRIMDMSDSVADGTIWPQNMVIPEHMGRGEHITRRRQEELKQPRQRQPQDNVRMHLGVIAGKKYKEEATAAA